MKNKPEDIIKEVVIKIEEIENQLFNPYQTKQKKKKTK